VYIDSEEVRERLDELLMGGGLEEIDDEDEDSHEDEDGSDREGGDEKNPNGRSRTSYASPYRTPEASSSQVYIGHHSKAPSAALASAAPV